MWDRLLGQPGAGQTRSPGWSRGEVFVHRNVAKRCRAGRLNCLSTIQFFAIDQLKVPAPDGGRHYGCGWRSGV